MSQYGNTPKNPPWVRSGQNMNVAQSTAAVPQSLMAANSLQTAAGMLQYPPVFQGQQMYGTVSYPTRALNTAAFQQGQQQGGGSQTGNRQQRVFTGTVTKAQDNFGFVDEDVFFQSSCCVEGSSPQVGDSVLVEAVYNANMPIKWNATRIQVLKMQDQRPGQSYRRSQSNYNAVPPPKTGGGTPTSNRFSGGGSRFSNATVDRGGRGGGGGGSGSTRRDEPDSRKRRRDDRDKDDKAKSPPRKRSKSPNRQASRRPRRPVPRYSVSVPKINLNTARADVVEVKKRYPNMYVPSDFFLSMFRWTETFPIGKPVSLDFPCAFHVMHKDVDNVVENNAVLEPPDADYLYSAKVMLMASPGLDDLYSKCIVMAEDREGSRSTVDEDSLSHPSRLIHFLVGTRGKENMAIGGPWSPSLDGADPVKDPGVLVKTAIRTTLALTGIDLSNCTQWFRFVEVHYHRGESVHRGKSYPARVETVVIFVPDVWSCVPTRLEWDGLQLNYQKALARKINDHDQKEEEEEVSEKESQSEPGADKPKKEPKHFSELDPKNMKVSELREELEARCLSPKGLKSQLAARLAKTIKSEEEEDTKQKLSTEEESGTKKDDKDVKEKKEEQKEKEPKEDEKKKKEEEEPKKLDEKEKQLLEKRYKLPKKPSLLVHPNRTAKSGKFDCHYYSLSILLGYRQDDTKEHSFEVSIFAEIFNEMLMRDFGFNIYRAIVEAPEKPKEEKKEEKEKDKPKEDKKDDREKSRDDKDKPKDEKEKPKEDDKEKEIKKEKDTVKETKEENKESSDSKQKVVKVKDEEMDVHSEPEEIIEDDKEEKENKENDKDKKGDKEPRRERAKLITLDKELLLSFVFFDITRCGYIYDKDIEDLLFSLGLTLSRSQVRKLVSKVVSRDAVYYRRLTDRPEGTSHSDHMPTEQLIALKPSVPYNSSHEKGSPNGGIGLDTEVKTGQVISFNGALVDIGKLMEQLTRSETARIDTEKSLGKLRDELTKLKETTSKSEKYIKDLNADVRDYRDRLSQTSSELSTLQVKERQYMRTLNEISEKIKPLIAKPEPKPEPEIKEIIDLEDKGEEPMSVDDK